MRACYLPYIPGAISCECIFEGDCGFGLFPGECGLQKVVVFFRRTLTGPQCKFEFGVTVNRRRGLNEALDQAPSTVVVLRHVAKRFDSLMSRTIRNA